MWISLQRAQDTLVLAPALASQSAGDARAAGAATVTRTCERKSRPAGCSQTRTLRFNVGTYLLVQ